MKCLGVEQHEENRYKVQLGREIHEKREAHNKDYLRKKIGSLKKESEVNLVSQRWGIRGKIDEIHYLEDGTMAPLDYKFACFEDKIYETYRTQIILYSLMIEEIFGIIVKSGFLVYCRDGNKLVEVKISNEDKRKFLKDWTSINTFEGIFSKGYKLKADVQIVVIKIFVLGSIIRCIH
jgi:CRISPR-associated exonuclease Cas4